MAFPELEKEPGLAFDRGRCIDNSLNSFKRPYFFGLSPDEQVEGRFLEERYLAEDAFVDQSVRVSELRIPSVEKLLSARVAELIQANTISLLTDTQLSQYRAETQEQSKQVGKALEEKGRQLGLSYTTDPSVFAETLELEKGIFFERLGSRSGQMKDEGWEIYRDKQGKYQLVMPYLVTSDEVIYTKQLTVTDLDGLYQKDPAFVEEQLRKYHFQVGTSQIINRITYDLALHQIDGPSYLPELLSEFTKSPERSQNEVDSIVFFLKVLVTLNPNLARNFFNFRQKMVDARYQRLPADQDTRSVSLEVYLKHISECPGLDEETHIRYGNLLLNFNKISSIHAARSVTSIADSLPVSSEEAVSILQRPVEYMGVLIDEAEEASQKDKQRNSLLAEFIEETADIKDIDLFLQKLKEALPEEYLKLDRFKKWLGEKVTEKGSVVIFDEMVRGSKPDIELGSLRYLRDITQIINSRLAIHGYTRMPRQESFEGVNIQFGEASIIDQELSILVSLIVMKHAQSEFEKGNYQYSSFDKEQKPASLQLLVQEIGKSYRSSANKADQSLKGLRRKRSDMGQLLAALNLSTETIDNLYKASLKESDNRVPIHNSEFMILFDALYFSRKGLLDVNSQLFKRVMITVLPGITYEMIAALQNAAA